MHLGCPFIRVHWELAAQNTFSQGPDKGTFVSNKPEDFWGKERLTFTVRALVWFWADTHFGGAAKSISRTVVVFLASLNADTLGWVVRISNGARWTATLVRSRQVFASCSETAGAYRLTFINI
jgi:hypothetical protein